jgi:hypothetical protein
MGNTPTLILPYPELTDTADVPRDVKALADRLDKMGGILAFGTWASNTVTSGTSFAAGANLLSANLSFTAVTAGQYLFTIAAAAWTNGTATGSNFLNLVLDGADAGQIAAHYFATASVNTPLFASTVITPAAGVHTVNARMYVLGTPGTVFAAAGGPGAYRPLYATIQAFGQ